MMYISFYDFLLYYYGSFFSLLIIYFCQCQMLYIALVCEYFANMDHLPSGLSKINSTTLVIIQTTHTVFK